jgi:hypothetical protein
MRKLIAQTASASVALALVSGVSLAKNPLLDGSSSATVVVDKDLAGVKGSGSTTAIYSFYGGYYGSYARLNASYGDYYNYVSGTGASSTATGYYYNAQYYAYYSYVYYNAAYNAARAGT